MRGPNGEPIQSGLGLSSLHGATRAPSLSRGVVLATHYADDPVAQAGRVAREVLCTVLLLNGWIVSRVPVLQRGSGISNGSLWIPQPTTHNLDTGEVITFTDGQIRGKITNLDALNGERVLIDFIANDPSQPVIVGSMGHPRTRRAPEATPINLPDPAVDGSLPSAPQGQARWIGHQGSTAQIDSVGNVRINTTAAGTADHGGRLDAERPGLVDLDLADGAEVVIRFQGEVAFRLRVDSSGDGPGRVSLDLGAGASQRVVLGDRFQALFDGHRHTTFYGQTGPVAPEATMTAAQADPARAALSDRVKVQS